jgi:hypothetical protein
VRDSVAAVHELVSNITRLGPLETEHIADTLRWLETTDDVFRRSKPATPDRHLVCRMPSFSIATTFDVLLVDHVNSGLFLPPGGHAEPDEHPAGQLVESAARSWESKPPLPAAESSLRSSRSRRPSDWTEVIPMSACGSSSRDLET